MSPLICNIYFYLAEIGIETSKDQNSNNNKKKHVKITISKTEKQKLINLTERENKNRKIYQTKKCINYNNNHHKFCCGWNE